MFFTRLLRTDTLDGRCVRPPLQLASLAVDGVLMIGGHGQYPESSTGQFVFPRRIWFEEIVREFDRGGRVVPVFCDKHLADNWTDARWIYDEARQRKIPLMAGSSVPPTWRYPPVDSPMVNCLKNDAGTTGSTMFWQQPPPPPRFYPPRPNRRIEYRIKSTVHACRVS